MIQGGPSAERCSSYFHRDLALTHFHGGRYCRYWTVYSIALKYKAGRHFLCESDTDTGNLLETAVNFGDVGEMY